MFITYLTLLSHPVTFTLLVSYPVLFVVFFQSTATESTTDNNCSNSAAIEPCSNAAPDSTEVGDTVIEVTNNLEALHVAETESDLPSESSTVDVKGTNETSEAKDDDNELAARDVALVKETANEGEVKSDDDEFAALGEAIIEHYIRETEDEGCAMARGVLRRGAEFWTSNGLPAARLEALFSRHIDRLFYPLGLMLFR